MKILAKFIVCLAVVWPTFANARVDRLEILSRTPFADGFEFGPAGAYERIKGRLHFAIDPADPANTPIVDIHLAPVDLRGLITFSAEFILLKPADPSLGNGRLLYDVNNRGSLTALGSLNNARWSNDPTDLADAGNGFLMFLGYSYLSSAWNWDVTTGDDRLQIDLPIARENSTTITGPVAAEITVDEVTDAAPFAWGFSRGYEPASADHTLATLTRRLNPDDPRQVIPHDQWRISGPTEVTLDGGFQPGLLYELVYPAKDPRVVGLGLAAIRDAISFFRFDGADDGGQANPMMVDGVGPQAVIAYGISQSGRLLQHMVMEALHVDAAGRMVFDAAMIHVAGGGKGSFNHRFAPTTRHQSQREDQGAVADFFPFATVPVTDPVTGETASILDRARAAGAVPNLVYTMTSTEYWTRSASLLHTDVIAANDVGLDPKARLYFIAGAQHNNGFGLDRGIFENCRNPLDHRPILRALFLATDRWATTGAEPPPSQYPTLAAGTLGTVAQYTAAFPTLGDVRLPQGNLQPRRLDLGPRFTAQGIVDLQPAVLGDAYGTLVPMVDADGLDLGGIRLPGVAVPLGTYTGWNLRHRDYGAPNGLGRWAGSFIPFSTTAAERADLGDPRRSLAERYSNRSEFLSQTKLAADTLAADGFILTPDIPDMVAKAGRAYDVLVGPRATGCTFLEGFG
ncbi:MAG: hypothetical protein HOB82_10610 [Alphaproteobacteria bacterium]|nr:hypothetical protein [Alphaproteobacteria bacterium]MBT5860651.1 hypothetical protein [Alphaproteobacteria bacterium]